MMGTFWADVRRDYKSFPAEVREDWQQMREEWRDLIAGARQHRQITNRMWQRVTGKTSPTRRDKHRARKAILAEAGELDAIMRRVIAEHGQEDGHGS